MVCEFNYFAGKPFSRGGYRTMYLRDTVPMTKEQEQHFNKSKVMSRRAASVPPLDSSQTRMLNGETMYAGQQEVLGEPGMPGFNKGTKALDSLFENELKEKYGGSLESMSKKFGLEPTFMRWRQTKVTGGFEAIQKRKQQARAEIERTKLLSIAFEIKKPITAGMRDSMTRGMHGTTPATKQRIDRMARADERWRQSQRYRRDVSHWEGLQRAATALPETGREASRSPPPQRPPALARPPPKKPLSKAALIALKLLLDRLEEVFTSVNLAFRLFDKDGTGHVTHKEFKFMCQDRFNLPISDAIVAEILRSLDADGSGQVDFQDIQQCFGSAIMASSESAFSNKVGTNKPIQLKKAAPPIENEDLITRLVRQSLSEKAQKLYTAHRYLVHPTYAGHVTKQELQGLIKKCNINLEPTQYSIFYNSLEKNEHGAVPWRVFWDSVQPGNGANAKKIGGMQDECFISQNVERVTIPPWFTREPNYRVPNKWDLQGTWKHPAGAGFDNRHMISYYSLTTSKKSLDDKRGEIFAVMEGQGLKKVQQGGPHPMLTFQRRADQISGFEKMHGVFGEEGVSEIMGEGFAPRLRARSVELQEKWHQASRPRFKAGVDGPARTAQSVPNLKAVKK